jgi:hypothetical protein
LRGGERREDAGQEAGQTESESEVRASVSERSSDLAGPGVHRFLRR